MEVCTGAEGAQPKASLGRTRERPWACSGGLLIAFEKAAEDWMAEGPGGVTVSKSEEQHPQRCRPGHDVFGTHSGSS